MDAFAGLANLAPRREACRRLVSFTVRVVRSRTLGRRPSVGQVLTLALTLTLTLNLALTLTLTLA